MALALVCAMFDYLTVANFVMLFRIFNLENFLRPFHKMFGITLNKRRNFLYSGNCSI